MWNRNIKHITMYQSNVKYENAKLQEKNPKYENMDIIKMLKCTHEEMLKLAYHKSKVVQSKLYTCENTKKQKAEI